jgi:hypothetical protein
VTEDFLPQRKPTNAVVLSEISNPNGKIRQTGEANWGKRSPLFKMAVGHGKFFGLYF